ncbi:unnamed protein product [Prorocentrum cordatum]|uniref:Mechanosensitive ion channel MscS domain-containing protein n=1 Tax=Prorocentrum cordatum TaxID=2364126 RepID=A0ABN9W333_9DINO|nr:unnamed protein product [Polarella glacialis]
MRPEAVCRGLRCRAVGGARRPLCAPSLRASARSRRLRVGAAGVNLSFGCSRGWSRTALRLAMLAVLQLRFVPRAWAVLRRNYLRMNTQRAEIATAEELLLVREALSSSSRLGQPVELSSCLLPKGSEILAHPEDLAAATPPVRLRYRPPSRADAGPLRYERIWASFTSILRIAEGPLVFYGWGRMASEAGLCLAGRFLAVPPKGGLPLEAWCGKLSQLVAFTSLALFSHSFISAWRDRRSRGRAETSDFLGSQSSLREAQVNALKVALQVLVWAVYAVVVLWALGVQVGRVLLFPSITAVVLGWVGREIVANIISGVILHLTQPFAQGDWVTLEGGDIDGWVQDVGNFYTKVVQWDKRPMYVPNFKLMSMNVQNNSRMTNRRVLFELPLRMRDIPKIPKIVQEMQEMINSHEDIDTVQHRLVRWRSIGQYSAEIWVSCYTKPTMEGIRLATFTATLQSVLERCSAIVYSNGAEFASINDRYGYPRGPGVAEEVDDPKNLGQIITDKLYSTFSSARESQLKSREQVLWEREKNVKQLKRDVEAAAALQRDKDRRRSPGRRRGTGSCCSRRWHAGRALARRRGRRRPPRAPRPRRTRPGPTRRGRRRPRRWRARRPPRRGAQARAAAEEALSGALSEAAAPPVGRDAAESIRGLQGAVAEASRVLQQEGPRGSAAAEAPSAAGAGQEPGEDGGQAAGSSAAAAAEEAEIEELKIATPGEIQKAQEVEELAAAESQAEQIAASASDDSKAKSKGRIPVKEMGD